MSSRDRAKKRQERRNRHAKPSAPRIIGANDNHPEAVNDNRPVLIGGVTLSPLLGASFRRAEKDLAASDLDRRREGQEALRQIEAHLAEVASAREMKAVRSEIDALERGRGGELSVERVRDNRGKDGEVLKVGRDGLAKLAQTKTDQATGEKIAPTLTSLKWAAGLRYRTDYERADPERLLTPPTLLREGKSKAGGGEGYDAKVAESWARIRTIHLMIAGLPLETARQSGGDEHSRPSMPNLPAGHPAMRAIHALTEIAGKGRILSEMTNSGSVRARIRDDLIFALEACEIVYGLA